MKYLMIAITLMLSNTAMANQESCSLGGCKQTRIEQDVNTPARDELKDATIIVRRKDGTEEVMDANTFKVVRRKQQFKVKERVIEKTVVCQQPAPEPVVLTVVKTETKTVLVKAKERKNILAVGGAYDYTGLTAEVNGNTGTVYSNRGLVLDLSYYRRQLFDSRAGLGVGINTNGSPRAFVGWEF